jgi:hypothetical protein
MLASFVPRPSDPLAHHLWVRTPAWRPGTHRRPFKLVIAQYARDYVDPRCECTGSCSVTELGYRIEDTEAVDPTQAIMFTLLQEQLHSVLDTLSEREAGVVSMRFGLADGQAHDS